MTGWQPVTRGLNNLRRIHFYRIFVRLKIHRDSGYE